MSTPKNTILTWVALWAVVCIGTGALIGVASHFLGFSPGVAGGAAAGLLGGVMGGVGAYRLRTPAATASTNLSEPG